MSDDPAGVRRVRQACRRALGLLAGLGLVMLSTSAWADPCKAIPDKGPMPAYLKRGAAFAGPVVYVGDGDGLCVAVGAGLGNWVEVRLADFYAPELAEPGGAEAKQVLVDLALGKSAVCIAQKQSYDRVVAVCRLGGTSFGDLMRGRGIQEAGRGRAAAIPVPNGARRPR
jgi:endonuclease YncB( thermonuclease family)